MEFTACSIKRQYEQQYDSAQNTIWNGDQTDPTPFTPPPTYATTTEHASHSPRKHDGTCESDHEHDQAPPPSIRSEPLPRQRSSAIHPAGSRHIRPPQRHQRQRKRKRPPQSQHHKTPLLLVRPLLRAQRPLPQRRTLFCRSGRQRRRRNHAQRRRKLAAHAPGRVEVAWLLCH